MSKDIATPVSEHACMGLNECKGLGGPRPEALQGKGAKQALEFLENLPPNKGKPFAPGQNDCAGQGSCATASFHSCHTNNNCAGQGGCGLYGWEPELAKPGQNACQSMGSCAVPINAERFVTDGLHRGDSVWHLARKAFEKAYQDKHGKEPAASPMPDGPKYNEYLVNLEGVAACGSSGMSGAGSCS